MLMACQINKNKINIVSKLIKKIYGLLSIQFTNRKLYMYIKVNDVYLYFYICWPISAKLGTNHH